MVSPTLMDLFLLVFGQFNMLVSVCHNVYQQVYQNIHRLCSFVCLGGICGFGRRYDGDRNLLESVISKLSSFVPFFLRVSYLSIKLTAGD